MRLCGPPVLGGVGFSQELFQGRGTAVMEIRAAIVQAAQRGRVPELVRAAVCLQLHIVILWGSVMLAMMATGTAGLAVEDRFATFGRHRNVFPAGWGGWSSVPMNAVRPAHRQQRARDQIRHGWETVSVSDLLTDLARSFCPPCHVQGPVLSYVAQARRQLRVAIGIVVEGVERQAAGAGSPRGRCGN